MRTLPAWVAVVVVGSACRADERASAPPPPAPADAEVVAPAIPPPPPPPPVPEFPEGTRALRLRRSMPVRLEPGTDAKRIGTVAQDTRVSWKRTAKAEGCKQPWVEIEPRGWVCGEYLEPLTKRPSGVELPRLERGERVPGIYGKVTDDGAMVWAQPEPPKQEKGKRKGDRKQPAPVASPTEVDPPAAANQGGMIAARPLLGSVNVRKYGELTVGGKSYWKISRGNEYVLAKSIREHAPSDYQGVRLGDDTGLELPVAFVWPRKHAPRAWTQTAPRGARVRALGERAVVPVLETADKDGAPVAYRIGEGEWIDAADVRVARLAEPPPLIGEHERWFDIDLDTQILVAYEGTRPVYATLVSTGRKTTPTETGIWRMWKKVSETDMRGLGEDPYSVATVPWTQFFEPLRGLALHAAYWHDRFGTQRSHGCINLAPADARWLYFWSEPQVPPGWTMTAGVVEAPGSIVRVRSAADPNPAFKGYAIKVQEERERLASRGP